MTRLDQSKKLNIFIRDNFKCVYCKRKFSHKVKLTIDHVIPKCLGGKNTNDNLVTCCKECNQLKADKNVKEFINENTKRWKRYNGKKGHRNA